MDPRTVQIRRMVMMKRVFSLLAALALLLFCLGPAAAEEGTVVVKNYSQLAEALNNRKAEKILIAARYKHGTKEIINLEPEGRTVTILPENGESALINGRVDIAGEGTVIFENVSIEGPAGEAGLWVGGGASVSIGSVTGGKAVNDNGCPAVIVEDGTLTIGRAVGSDGRTGFGGDGIFAFGNSAVTVHEALGGSAKKGFGGSGAVVFGSVKITVSGSAAGGNGLYAAGKGVLAGLNGTVDGDGTLADGSLLDGKKTIDPETVINRITLEHAVRSGKTEILLSPKFRAGSGFLDDLLLFSASEAPVRIASESDEKPATVDCQLGFCDGTWKLDNLRLSMNSREWARCLWAVGSADVTATGSITAKGETCGIYATDNAKVEYTGDCVAADYGVFATGSASVVFNGNISEANKKMTAAGTNGNASLTINGDITVTADANALLSYGGKLEMTGSVQASKNHQYPVIYIRGGEIILNGPLSCEGQATAVYNKGGSVTINGDVTDMTTKKYPVQLTESAGTVTINGTLTASHTGITADGGAAVLNGDLIVISKDNWAMTSWNDPGSVTVNGELKHIIP